MKSSNSFGYTGHTIEDIMLDFLKAITPRYSDVLVLKGCMCLKLHLGEKFKNNFRMTRDIDFHFKDFDSWNDFCENCCDIATEHSKLGIEYKLMRRHDRSQKSSSISVETSEDISFKIDMNVGINTKAIVALSDVFDCTLKVNSIYGILADKLNVMKSRKICRRIKDFIDINYILENLEIDLDNLINLYKKLYPVNEGVEEVYFLNPKNLDDIEHAYAMYSTTSYKKPDFMETYEFVCEFCSVFYSRLYKDDLCNLVWKEGKFVECNKS